MSDKLELAVIEERQLAVVKHNASTIFAALLAADVPAATVVFYGGGDSGSTDFDGPSSMPEAVLASPHLIQSVHRHWGRLEDGGFGYTETTVIEKKLTLRQLLCEVADAALDATYGNWFDGDIRTHGQVRFDAVERTIVIDMTSYEPKEVTFSIEVGK